MRRSFTGHRAGEALTLSVSWDNQKHRHSERKYHGGQYADHDRHVCRIVVFCRRDRRLALGRAILLDEDIALDRRFGCRCFLRREVAVCYVYKKKKEISFMILKYRLILILKYRCQNCISYILMFILYIYIKYTYIHICKFLVYV